MDDAVGSHDSGVFFKQFPAGKIKRVAAEVCYPASGLFNDADTCGMVPDFFP